MKDYARVLSPHLKEAIFVNLGDKTLVRWGVHFENFIHELLDCCSLQKHHRRIVATKIDRPPVGALRLQIHGPKVPISVMRDWEAVRHQKVRAKAVAEASASEIDLFEGTFNTR